MQLYMPHYTSRCSLLPALVYRRLGNGSPLQLEQVGLSVELKDDWAIRTEQVVVGYRHPKPTKSKKRAAKPPTKVMGRYSSSCSRINQMSPRHR